MVYESSLVLIKNMSITSKTKHPIKWEKKYQDGRTQVLANEESSKEGRLIGKWEQIK
jgi:hypothetical protein